MPVQVFANRADEPGGSTLGNLLGHQVSIPMVDIGMAQLAMHSAVETAGAWIRSTWPGLRRLLPGGVYPDRRRHVSILISAVLAERSARLMTVASACRTLFDRLMNFGEALNEFKKLFDPTRKGTLTVPFHTILPFESLAGKLIDPTNGSKFVRKAGPSYDGPAFSIKCFRSAKWARIWSNNVRRQRSSPLSCG